VRLTLDFTSARIWFFIAVCLLVFGLSRSIHASSILQRFMMAAPPTISTQEIRNLLADGTRNSNFVIVDVRSEAEVSVSVIPSAISRAEFERTAADHQGKEIITYCTIGVRSGRFAKKLIQQGWKARNYKGSIIDWCKNKLPLVTHDGEETQQVHTYSARYSVPDDYKAIF
ncbi:rhodanese-like domain-containing protein, partial [Mariniblastus sp.]|nr:rhodanese-like domain-containing protein [Mariniblastus sp.]